MLTISALAVLLFSAVHPLRRAAVVNGGETNYVTATLSIFISVYNVFSSLLQPVHGVGGNRD